MLTKVVWGNELSWSVQINGSKNASLPIIAACLLLKWKVRLNNVPDILDVHTFLWILESIWAKYTFARGVLDIDTSDLSLKNLDEQKVKKVRVSLLLLAPLLHHFHKLNIPYPGGCSIWKRPVDSHLNALDKIWFKYISKWENRICLDGKPISGDMEINAGFSVTATENILVANTLREGTTTIKMAAIEPHVMNLVDFLRKAWADISLRYNHTIIVKGVEKLTDNFEFDIVSDYIESGTFMVIWALAAKEYIDIHNARIDDLYAFIEKLHQAWVKTMDMWNDILRVYKAKEIKNVNIQTNIFPGFPTDLQSPFWVLMTQAEWVSKIHEVMFEWRLNFLVELEKMGSKMSINNSHEAIIMWATPLKWATVTSWDLRAWAAMVIAWLIARWETYIANIDYVKRWYSWIFEKLTKLWADIVEWDEN